MLNFSKCIPIGLNIQRVCYKCTSEKSVYNLRKCLRQNKEDVFGIIQIRCTSNAPPPNPPPPPGLGPPSPPPPPGLGSSNRSSFEGIPYVYPGRTTQQSPTRYIMILIPIISFGLGTWQVKRLKWKNDLINTMNTRKIMDPVPLPLNPDEVAQMEFQKVTVTGVFDHENELFYGPKPCFIKGEPVPNIISKDGQGSYGFNLVTPFIVSETGQRILVNRGWIATRTLKKDKRPWSLTEGEQTITGVVRNSEPPNKFAPTGDLKLSIWHNRDIETMAVSRKCLPIYIDLVEEHSIPNHIWAGQTITKLRNEHLSYALTWYALSIATALLWYARYMKR